MTNPWRAILQVWAVTAVAAAAAVAALILVVDPYDTGRIRGLGLGFTREQAPRTANASRARNARFDAAVLGNSHVQLLSPARLGAATGATFASLIVPGSGIPEQLAVLDYFMRWRPAPPRILIFGVDEFTCRTGLGASQSLQVGPFPFWLYAPGLAAYLRGAFRYTLVEDAVTLLTGSARATSLADADGFWNYEANKVWAEAAAATRIDASQKRPMARFDGPFPAVEALSDRIQALPSTTRVVIVAPPVYAPLLAPPGSREDAAEAACKARIAAIATQRPHTRFLDFHRDTPVSRSKESFWDGSHMTGAVAQEIEAAIVKALATDAD
ncbi:hypothetical protein ABEG18_10780 [Alsobacter sp. KACC 23698]|uniref:SGNH/GDSL hydrolase family protein n=1 Tax=Alsobacter sp. KACC 23698 TaxID=3149229 RepID=A0AAU7JLE4_9HYPH